MQQQQCTLPLSVHFIENSKHCFCKNLFLKYLYSCEHRTLLEIGRMPHSLLEAHHNSNKLFHFTPYSTLCSKSTCMYLAIVTIWRCCQPVPYLLTTSFPFPLLPLTLWYSTATLLSLSKHPYFGWFAVYSSPSPSWLSTKAPALPHCLPIKRVPIW